MYLFKNKIKIKNNTYKEMVGVMNLGVGGWLMF